MTILAITPFAGSEKLTVMTANMLAQLMRTLPTDEMFKVVALANKPDRILRGSELPDGVQQMTLPANIGFGRGIDHVIEANAHDRDITDVLVLNNDLEFPQHDWLQQLLFARETNYVLAPMTNCTATDAALSDGPQDKAAMRVHQVSAYCWCVPMKVCRFIKPRFGCWLFPPQFTNYGSDDASAAILRKCFGTTPFKIVRRSWVRHLKAQTAKELGVKQGTKELLTELKTWKSAHKLK